METNTFNINNKGGTFGMYTINYLYILNSSVLTEYIDAFSGRLRQCEAALTYLSST